MTRELDVTVCWIGERSSDPRARYALRVATREVPARIADVRGRLDLESLRTEPADALGPNDLGDLRLDLGDAVAVDPFDLCRATGAILLVDPTTEDVVAMGTVRLPGRA